MCRAVAAYLQGLRAAWLRGVQPGHDLDTELTAYEEANECLEASRTGYPPPAGVGLAAAVSNPPDPGSGGHPKSCPYCAGDLCCDVAAEDIDFYRWEHGLK